MGSILHQRYARLGPFMPMMPIIPRRKCKKSYAVKGEVVVVDKAAAKVNLQHEAIPELE